MTAKQSRPARPCQRDQNHLIIFLTLFHVRRHVSNQSERVPRRASPTAREVNSISVTFSSAGVLCVCVMHVVRKSLPRTWRSFVLFRFFPPRRLFERWNRAPVRSFAPRRAESVVGKQDKWGAS